MSQNALDVKLKEMDVPPGEETVSVSVPFRKIIYSKTKEFAPLSTLVTSCLLSSTPSPF